MTPRPESTRTAAAKSPAGALALAFMESEVSVSPRHDSDRKVYREAMADLRALLAERDALAAKLAQSDASTDAMMGTIDTLRSEVARMRLTIDGAWRLAHEIIPLLDACNPSEKALKARGFAAGIVRGADNVLREGGAQ